MTKTLTAAVLSLFCAAALAVANEVVVLKGGKTLELSKPYVLRGSQAVMTLKDGTVISVATADIDHAATRAARRPAKAGPEVPAAALTPAEAARAQKANPKARVKIGDADVGHVLGGGESEAAAGEGTGGETGGDAKVDVVDFDQRPSGNAVVVKGTLRNVGKVPADNVSLSVAAIDETGKTVATATASVAAGSLDSGSSASFSASLPMTARATTLRFTPRWTTPAPAPAAGGSGAAATPAGAAAPGTPAGGPAAAPAKPAPPPPAPEKKEPTYRPQPDYAPPPANAPMAPTGDIHTGYIPGAHEETPPPPPPPSV